MYIEIFVSYLVFFLPDGAEPSITGPTPLYNCLKPPD